MYHSRASATRYLLGASIEQRPRRYRFRFADVFLPAGFFTETFLVADFVRVRAAGFRFGFRFVGAPLPIFAPVMPPTTAPTAAPIGPRNDPSAAPAAAPPAVPKLELVSSGFVSESLVFSIFPPLEASMRKTAIEI
jgi:hypothetical protein